MLFDSRLYIFINATVYKFRITLFIIRCNFVVVSKFRIKIKITIVDVGGCCIRFCKIHPMIYVRPKMVCTKFLRINFVSYLIACNIPIFFLNF